MTQTARQETLPFSILTDLPSADAMHKHAEKLRRNNKALDALLDILETRMMPRPRISALPLDEKDLSLAQGELLLYLVTTIKPILTVETGFDYGLVTGILSVGHALNGLSGGHVPMHERASTMYRGAGMHLLQTLEISGHQIMDHEPALVLPQIYTQKLNEGMNLAYMNYAQDFDEQMMEYFYLNRLLHEGGVIAIPGDNNARNQLIAWLRQERHDYAVRELPCGITLVQKPPLTALEQHQPSMRH